MQAVILALATISAPLLILTAALGYLIAFDAGTARLGTHVNAALITTLMVTMSHVITIFYFVGTGAAIERETRERGLDRIYMDEASHFRRRLFPWALLATFLTMATATIGAGVHVRVLPPLLHHGLALLTLLCNGIALGRVPGSLVRNNQLLDAAAEAQGATPGIKPL